MPKTPITLFAPEKPRKHFQLEPPNRTRVTPIRIKERAADVELVRYNKRKNELFALLEKDIDALYAANDTAEDYTLSDIEKAHDTFVASGLMYRILMAKRV